MPTKATQAMIPDFFEPAIKEVTKTIKAPKEGEENLILEFSESQTWEYIKGIIESIQESLRQGAKKSAGTAKDWEHVAKIYYGRDVSIDSFQTIIDMIELHKKAKYAPKPDPIQE